LTLTLTLRMARRRTHRPSETFVEGRELDLAD
jgi:hypothetical protein